MWVALRRKNNDGSAEQGNGHEAGDSRSLKRPKGDRRDSACVLDDADQEREDWSLERFLRLGCL